MYKVIVGLGNPGKQYEKTRHNIGFMVLDVLAKKLDLKWKKSKNFVAEIAKDSNVLLLKPQTFMNNSGLAVTAVLSYYKLTPKNLTVIHDDLDIELGKHKESVDSRSAGHNGVQNIIDQLGTKNFKRLRIGIKTPDLEKIPADKFVLQKFNGEEAKIIRDLIARISETI